jgi:hypothetical protein
MPLATRRAVLLGAFLVPALFAAPANAQYFRAAMSGANENPPNASQGLGTAIVYLDGSQITLTGSFRNLGSNYLASHIHQGAVGVNGPIVFPLAPTVDGDQRGGRFEGSLNTFAASPAQVTALTSGDYYVNVHSATISAGEIRGQLTPSVVINELRVDQPSTDNDEYVELAGPAGASLNGMTYVVIGDGAAGSGVIEYILPLDGQTIPSDGIWLGGGGDDLDNMVLGVTVDFQFDPLFENSDAVTHLIVTGFTGTDAQDLDTDDNGSLDVTPWATVIDAIGLADDTTPDFPYGINLGFIDLPANGTFPFAHGFRDGATGEWRGGAFDPAGGQDTPGTVNTIVVANEPGTPSPALALTVDANPAHHHVGIRYTLPEAATVRLALFDAAGREVAVIVEEARPSGRNATMLDASGMADGVYLLRLTAGGNAVTRTITIAH